METWIYIFFCAPTLQFCGFKALMGGRGAPEDMEMERYGLQDIFGFGPLNKCLIFNLMVLKRCKPPMHCFAAAPEDMEMERYGLEPIGARYPISTLSLHWYFGQQKSSKVKDSKSKNHAKCIQHLFILSIFVARKISVWIFPWSSNYKSVIFSQLSPHCSSYVKDFCVLCSNPCQNTWELGASYKSYCTNSSLC